MLKSLSSAFPSKYLRASDLNGQPVKFVIDHVEIEEMGFGNTKDEKPVLYFRYEEKGLVLNKTNANTIIFAYGDDPAGYTGKELVLYPTMVEFQGKQNEVIRVRLPKASDDKPADKPTAKPQTPPADMDDDVPF